MSTSTRVIRLQPLAPPKPAVGQPCNGCGVCCSVAPCPAGAIATRHRNGPCRLLRWDGSRYRCGLLGSASAATLAQRLWQAYARRLIAAGTGCDSHCTVEPAAGG